MKIKRKFIIWPCVLVLVGILLFFAFQNPLGVTTYEIETNKLTKDIKIVFLADLHSTIYGENQKELISKIDAQKPDIILMSGDMADRSAPLDGTIQLLDGIADKYPCYYVTGNHEVGKAAAVKDTFRRYGVTVLEGECIPAEIGTQKINICGVDDPLVARGDFDAQVERAYLQAEKGLYTILLAHRPERIETYSKYDFDLVLSGHAHGGQWRIPYILPGGLISPHQGLFPKYTGGMYDKGDMKMLVTRGLTRESMGIPRAFNPPEIIVINLTDKSQ